MPTQLNAAKRLQATEVSATRSYPGLEEYVKKVLEDMQVDELDPHKELYTALGHKVISEADAMALEKWMSANKAKWNDLEDKTGDGAKSYPGMPSNVFKAFNTLFEDVFGTP